MENPSLVIVEKERIVALDLEMQVRKFGYNPIGFYSSGEELLKSITESTPDLVLMDLDLKGRMNGLDTAGIIREEHNIPVVLITAFLDDLSSEQKEGLLSYSYLAKPIVSKELKFSLDMAVYRHSMEMKLKETEDSYKRFFEEDLSGNFIADADGVVTACNSAFAEMLDFTSPLDVSGTELQKLFTNPDEGADFIQEVSFQKRLVMTERKMRTISGRLIQVVGNFMGQFNTEGELNGIIGYLQDTTEQKKLEEVLRQSQKLEAIGRLSGGIAHDFNNVLTIIQGYTMMLREKSEEGEECSEEIDGILSASKKAAVLTRQLLNFSRRQDLRPEFLDINRLLEELTGMIPRLLGEEVIIRFYLKADSGMVFADPGMLEQVFLNLAVNSRDAMPDGGTLSISTENRRVKGYETSVMGKIPEGDYVEIAVVDTGTGISPEDLEKIFEPFFTTKPINKGTGLGLSSVYGIIKQSGGYIRLESEPGKGTSFRINLPLRQGTPLKEEQDPGVSGEYRGTETLLIVEDDKDIRAIFIDALSHAGYRVLSVKNPGEALLICEKEEDIRLVVTDFMMPYLNGIQLVRRLSDKYPELKFILASGYPESAIRDKEPDMPEIPLIPKPLNPQKLLKLIRSVLDHSGSD